MSDLAKLFNDAIAINDTMTADDVLMIRERILFAKAKIRDLEETMEDGLLEWMRTNGDLVISEEKRLYIGRDKKVKCVDVAATLEAVLVATGGDFGAVCDCLASQPFKHGAARKPLGDQWDEHFITETVDRVKVKEADARFAKLPRKED